MLGKGNPAFSGQKKTEAEEDFARSRRSRCPGKRKAQAKIHGGIREAAKRSGLSKKYASEEGPAITSRGGEETLEKEDLHQKDGGEVPVNRKGNWLER